MTTAERVLHIQGYPGQIDFVEARTPYASMFGGKGSGKTRAGALRAARHMAEHPGAPGIVTAPTYDMLMLPGATIETYRQVFAPVERAWNKGDRVLDTLLGPIYFRSTDDPAHLQGPSVGWFHMDEAASSPYEAWTELNARLRGYPDVSGWITTTPKGFNWVYQEFVRSPTPDRPFWIVSTRDNPYLEPNYVERLAAQYHGEQALQDIEGQFVLVSGLNFFAGESLTAMMDDCRDPIEVRQGMVSIWRRPMVAGRYVGFGDCAWGQKGSYSDLVLADWQTGDQVAEIHGRPPLDELAKSIVDLCREYNSAYLGIEDNGEGARVVELVNQLGYGGRLYCRTPAHPDAKKRSWLTDGVTRPVMLAELEEAVRLHQIVPRCKGAVDEMMAFIRDEHGRPGPTAGAYADRVMAWAGLWQMRKHAFWGSAPRKVINIMG